MSDVQTEQPTETDQQQTETQQAEKTETSQQPDHSWVPKRISEITAARRAAEARAEAAEAELARLRSAPATETATPTPQGNQSVEELAKAYAQRMVKEQTDKDSLNQRIAAINEAGAKEFGDDFEKSVQNLGMAGIGGPDFLRVLTNIDGAEKLVTYLGKSENINEAMRIATLDPVKMGIELTKLSGKAAKALSKQISKAPPPTETIEGGRATGGDDVEPDAAKDPKAWQEWRAKNARKRR